MAKLFIFGIGGTGSRVIKSLAMLLAAGVKINADEIIPIIIDVDKANQDLTRTIEILKCYAELNKEVSRVKYEGFFQTMITDLFSVPGKEYRLEMQDVQGKKFDQYIDHQTLDVNNKRLIDLLFSQQNLNLDMQKGFQGNPNLGSVVLNQFTSNPDFFSFASNFSNGDRIFIISSIHGGTGSAGFPLLVKNLRNADVPLPNPDLIKKSIIGAITILPYFKLDPGQIKSQDFISKTKAALEYYIKNVNPSLNSLYYIGFEHTSPNYANHVGGSAQKNPAHFVELSAALSIVDFMRQSDANLQMRGSRFLEFGVKGFTNSIDFTTLGKATREVLFRPLTKYFFFKKYLQYQLAKSIDKQPWSNRGKKNDRLNSEFLTSNSSFYTTLLEFNEHFEDWLVELKDNKPSCELFNNSIANSKILNSISNMELTSKSTRKDNYVLFDDFLNASEKKIEGLSHKQKFVEIFNLATDRLITKKFK